MSTKDDTRHNRGIRVEVSDNLENGGAIIVKFFIYLFLLLASPIWIPVWLLGWVFNKFGINLYRPEHSNYGD